MKHKSVSRDDIQDVSEMALQLESRIVQVLEGNDWNLGMSALVSAVLNVLLQQCDTAQQLISSRNIFVHVFDNCIKKLREFDRTFPAISPDQQDH